MIGWSVGRLVGWSVGRLVGWSVGRLVGWSVGRLVGWSVGRLVGWSVGRLVGWSVGRLVGGWVGVDVSPLVAGDGHLPALREARVSSREGRGHRERRSLPQGVLPVCRVQQVPDCEVFQHERSERPRQKCLLCHAQAEDAGQRVRFRRSWHSGCHARPEPDEGEEAPVLGIWGKRC